ncbi:CsbD family protein [Lichenicoccus sp.]|uniref:CsbD family protein n=1 Tax=Lichenicoccus sp. TaxID=2781899 RepID=UPI003D0EF2AC
MDKHEAKGAFRDAIGKVKDGFGGVTGKPGTQLDGKIDQASGKLERKFGATLDDIKEQGADLAASGSRLTGQAAGEIRDATRTATSQVGNYAKGAADAGLQAGRSISESAERQPLLSLAAVAAAGYLVSFLVHSRNSPFAPGRGT